MRSTRLRSILMRSLVSRSIVRRSVVAGPLGLLVLAAFALPISLQAQAAPFAIMDNSFLVEEAFNQPAGVFQNIFLIQKAKGGGGWSIEFTQEWPVGGQRHQLSYTLPYDVEGTALGNVMLNYRLQASTEEGGGPAFSPRLSAILPTSSDAVEWGAQVNLPVSRQLGDAYLNVNAGATLESQEIGTQSLRLLSPHVAGSVIYRLRPLFHLMAESVATFEEMPAGPCCTTDRATTWIVSPGARGAFNLGDHQLTLGGAVPIVVSESSGAPYGTSLVLYLSYELPFKR
jgi:hypothetical protein